MRRLSKLALAAAPPLLVWVLLVLRGRAFPGETIPAGAYARIVLAVNEGHPRDAFAYLETQSQWACFTIGEYRRKAAAGIARAYPEPERSAALTSYQREAAAADGADVWAALAERLGFLARLRKDLSGSTQVTIDGERATIETAHGTRYTFRRRENGIWGLTTFTGELLREAEKAARDWDMVARAVEDYQRALREAPRPPRAAP